MGKSIGRATPARYIPHPASSRDPDPQCGDFDTELDHAQIEMHEGNPDAKLSIFVTVEGDDAKRLERIANQCRTFLGR